MSLTGNTRGSLLAGAQCYKQTYKFVPPQWFSGKKNKKK